MGQLNYFQTLSLFGSLLAIVVAFRVQRQMLRLQRAQEELALLQIAERVVAFRAEATDEAFVLRPFLADQDINNVTFRFPLALNIPPVVLAGGELKLHFSRIYEPIQSFWELCTPAIADTAAVRLTATLPLVAEIHGHTKGVAVLTRAFYDLYSTFIRQPDGSSILNFKGMSLNNYIPPSVSTEAALEEAYQAVASAVATK
jgi:hypothetical protein